MYLNALRSVAGPELHKPLELVQKLLDETCDPSRARR